MKTKVIFEGTRYDEKASEILANSGLFDLETSRKIIEGLFRTDIPAFHGSGHNWLEKYLKGIARMIVEEANGDPKKAVEFLETSPKIFDKYLTWVKDERPKVGNSLDDEFIEKMSYQDVVNKVNEIKDELSKKSQEELANMEFTSSNYTLVPINSFEEFNSKYGGNKTGDGNDENGHYAGNDGTAWCHANDDKTYERWTREGQHFFVLQNNDWEKIPFNPETNDAEEGKDAYGTSLIAILTDAWGQLDNATLRCNHVWTNHPQGIPQADNQYKTFAELSKVAGFNVEEKVKEFIGEIDESEFFVIQGTVLKKLRNKYKGDNCPKHLVIPEGVTTIAEGAFEDATFHTIVLPKSLLRIEFYAFYRCINLEKIDIPESVVEIGTASFERCISLEDVILPPINRIAEATFSWCINLLSVYIPEGVTEIGDHAFQHCEKLGYIGLPSTIKEIETGAFWGCGLQYFDIKATTPLEEIGKAVFKECHNLERVSLPDSVRKIYPYAFEGCDKLKELDLRNTSLVGIGNNAFEDCTQLEEIQLPKTVQIVVSNAFRGCSRLMHIVTPKLDNVEEWDVDSDCVIDFVGNTNESYQRKKELIKMKNEKDDKEVIYDADEEPEEGHFADDKDNLDFEDDIDEDEILVEDDAKSKAKDLALAVVELFDSDSMDWDTGVYENSEEAIDNLAGLKVMSQMSEEDWDKVWGDSNWSILQKFIEDHPNDAEEIFNTVADAFGFKNYADYKSYQDWVANEEEEYVKAMQDGDEYDDDRYTYDRTIDSPYQTDDDYYGSSSYLSSDEDFEYDEDNAYVDDSESYDWDEDEPEDLEEATNAGAITNVPASHKKIDLFTEDDEEIPEDDVLEELLK